MSTFQVIFNLRVAIVTLNAKELLFLFVTEVVPMARWQPCCVLIPDTCSCHADLCLEES